MKRETRIFHGAEIRVKKGAKPAIEGYAAVFDKRSVDLGFFVEMVRAGAFKRCLDSSPDVRGLYNHNPDNMLSRTTNKTLKMAEDSIGLHYEMDLADTQTARDVYSLIDRGDISGCSFSFSIPDRANGQSWNDSVDERGNYILLRELKDVDLYDVGPVTFPAYPDTSVDARSAASTIWPAGIPEDLRSHLSAELLARLDEPTAKPIERQDAGECACDCDACEADDCENCTAESCTGENCAHGARSAVAVSETELELMKRRLELAIR